MERDKDFSVWEGTHTHTHTAAGSVVASQFIPGHVPTGFSPLTTVLCFAKSVTTALELDFALWWLFETKTQCTADILFFNKTCINYQIRFHLKTLVPSHFYMVQNNAKNVFYNTYKQSHGTKHAQCQPYRGVGIWSKLMSCEASI